MWLIFTSARIVARWAVPVNVDQHVGRNRFIAPSGAPTNPPPAVGWAKSTGRANARPMACPPFSAKTFDSKNGGHGAKSAFAHPTDYSGKTLHEFAREKVPEAEGLAAPACDS